MGLDPTDTIPDRKKILKVGIARRSRQGKSERERRVDRIDVGQVEGRLRVRHAGLGIRPRLLAQTRVDVAEPGKGVVGEKSVVGQQWFGTAETGLADDIDRAADGVGRHLGRGDFRNLDAVNIAAGAQT